MRSSWKAAASVLLGAAVLGLGYVRMSSDRAAPVSSRAVPSHRSLARAPSGFASLPDRGDLLGYQARPAVRHEGATAWYRADISEAHAIKAIVAGEMTITTPGGEPVHLRYDRHVEHPNGNWTWFGRTAEGETAIVTFGEKAVFGRIPNGRQRELRIDTLAGRSWVAEVDLSKELNPTSKEPDYLIPPKLAASLASRHTMAAAPEELAVASAAAGAVTVDVALGYTTGLASALGGDSQAVTRLQYLVDLTNQVYASSQINAQIRLVKAIVVNYPDATSNTETLAKLSGYQSDTSSVPVDPAFNALRAARDEYGADLVSLVRQFRAPESGGCGLAWLIGKNQSGIDASDAPFGYSVVANGSDHNESDGYNYTCKELTLTHELGHNMGQSHNVEDAGGESGAHAYSYGYREARSTGFYTVMALPRGNEFETETYTFANPNVMVGGRPTGVADVADNARSMAQTMPIIATFRETKVQLPQNFPRADVDYDGKSDLLWLNANTRELEYWLMDGASIRQRRQGFFMAPGYTARTIGDFNGDHRADVIWANGSSVRLLAGTASGGFADALVGSFVAGWEIIGSGDVDADGKSDLLWLNVYTREFQYWLMDGSTIRSTRGGFFMAPGYVPSAVGDFNGDGRADTIWKNGGDVRLFAADEAGNFTDARLSVTAGNQVLVGAGDVDGDGKSDLLWHDPVTREFQCWLMEGATVRSVQGGFFMDPGFTVRSVGDFNGDGRADVVWANGNSARLFASNASGGFTDTAISSYSPGWDVIDDFIPGMDAKFGADRDGKADLFWYNTVSREFRMSRMDGASIQYVNSPYGKYFIAAGFTAKTVGDFDGDGHADIIWANGSSVRLFIAVSDYFFGDTLISSYSSDWDVIGSGDLDKDGKSDLLWFNATTREFQYWLMDGATIRAIRGGFFIAPGFTPSTVGDFNGDGRADLIWTNGNSARLFAATATGGFTDTLIAGYPPGWQVIGAGDINGDYRSDLYLFNPDTRELWYWLMNGSVIDGDQAGYFIAPGYSAKTIGDFNGDGRSDVIWANGSNLRLFSSVADGGNGVLFTDTLIGSYTSDWEVLHR